VQSQGFGEVNSDDKPKNDQCPGEHTHTGLDISGLKGTNIRAAADGIVRYAGTQGTCDEGWGSLVIVESKLTNGQTMCVIYGHVTPNVSENDLVTMGKTIVGQVAHFDCWGDHVHFGLYYGPYSDIACSPTVCYARGYLCSSEFPGNYVDPNKFLECWYP
jgi:murein DD-endopeptidase MepM/ murein hydrolase activator NlpD